MSPNYEFLLWVHIISGTISLTTGSIVMIGRKGDARHKKLGKLFFYALVAGAISAIGLAVVRFNPFLIAIGIFTLYLSLGGFRSIQRFQSKEHIQITRLDYAISLSMLFAALFFAVIGIQKVFLPDIFGWVYIFFALISLLFLLKDLQRFRVLSLDKNLWLLDHIRRMSGAYVATLTAFLVVNASSIPLPIPLFVYWILPTLILFPIIRRWVKKHKKKAKPAS